MTDKLEVCPICGSKGTELNNKAYCTNLYCCMTSSGLPIDIWNSRPLEDALQTELSNLKQSMRKAEKQMTNLRDVLTDEEDRHTITVCLSILSDNGLIPEKED